MSLSSNGFCQQEKVFSYTVNFDEAHGFVKNSDFGLKTNSSVAGAHPFYIELHNPILYDCKNPSTESLMYGFKADGNTNGSYQNKAFGLGDKRRKWWSKFRNSITLYTDDSEDEFYYDKYSNDKKELKKAIIAHTHHIIKSSPYSLGFYSVKEIENLDLIVRIRYDFHALDFSNIESIKIFGTHIIDTSELLSMPDGNCDMYSTNFINFYPDNEDMTVMHHRGNWKEVPENSKASIEAIFNSNSTKLPRFEIDVSMTKDGIIVATHDQVLQKLLQRMVDNNLFNATYDPNEFNYKKNTIHGMTWEELVSYNNNQPYLYDRYNESIISNEETRLWKEDELFTYLKSKKNSSNDFVVGFDLIVKPDYMKDDNKMKKQIKQESQTKIRMLLKKLIRLVTTYDLNDRVLFKFKGMLPHDDNVWDEIKLILHQYDSDKTDGYIPKIKYMPIVGKDFGSDAEVTDYINKWKNEAMNITNSHPYLEIDHFELWGNPFDDDEYQTWYKDLIQELKGFNPNFKFTRFELVSSASFGVWSDTEEFAYPEILGKPYNSIASLYNQGYNLLISDYPNMTKEFNDRAIGETLPNNQFSGDIEKTLKFNDISDPKKGFVLPLIIDKNILTNNSKQVFAQLTDANGDNPVWEFGIDVNNEFYVRTIFKDKTTVSESIYNYSNPIWVPRETGNFSEFNNNDKIFVAILQNKYYYNIFVGTPDGRFDNISFAYGFQNTALSDESVWNDTSTNSNNKNLEVSNTSGINQLPVINSTCHSDIFKFALDNYFVNSSYINAGHDYSGFNITSDGVTWSDYEVDKKHKIYYTLFDPENRFLKKPAKEKDKKLNDEDIQVYGNCNYFQYYFNSGRRTQEIIGRCAEYIQDAAPQSANYINNGCWSVNELNTNTTNVFNTPQLNSTQGWSAVNRNQGNYVGMLFDQPSGINGITTQGRANTNQWVTSYRLEGTKNGGTSWLSLGDYAGNTDRNTSVYNYVGNTDTDWTGLRIVPLTWVGYPSLRFEFTLCDTDNQSKNSNTNDKFDGDLTEINENLYQQAYVYPNPASNAFNLTFNAENEDLYTIKIADLQGRIINSQDVDIEIKGQQFLTFKNNGELSSGNYYIILSNNNKSQTLKLIIK